MNGIRKWVPSNDALGSTPRKRSNITAAVPPSTVEILEMEKPGRGQRSEGGGGGGVVVDYLAQFFPRRRRRGRILGEVVDAPS